MRSEFIQIAAIATLGLLAAIPAIIINHTHKVDVNLYSLITSDDHVLDYNLTLDDCYDLMLRSESDVTCYLQPEGEIE